MSEPIYRDPIDNGATDPTVIYEHGTATWWMFYTQRRPSDPDPSVRWIHATRIGVATSVDDGRSWQYCGQAAGLGHPDDTLWAPEVIFDGGQYRMYLSVVDGVPSDWQVPAHIEEYRSPDLAQWKFAQRLELGSERVIDAAIARTGDGRWRLWYKNERDQSSTWSAVSDDLDHWHVEGVAVPATPAHEGPNVFHLGGWYWMITDEWRGLGVHRSRDGIIWQRQIRRGGLILEQPGNAADDRAVAHHADVVVDPSGTEAAIFYFTHPHGANDTVAARPSAVHVAALVVEDDTLLADRDLDLANGVPALRLGAS